MKTETFEAGETVFLEGDDSTHTYHIISGAIDIVIDGRDRGEARIAALGPDEVFGEMGIIDPAPRSASAIARERTACAVYTADEVIDLMVSDPAQAIGLIRSLIIRLRNANRKLAAGVMPAARTPAETD